MRKAKFVALLLLPVSVVIFGVTLFAHADGGYSDEAIASVSDNCESIKLGLRHTQISDASSRTYLGDVYERALARHVTPLNIRLVRNNITAPESLASFQSRFASARAAFVGEYTRYARDYDQIMKIDCGKKLSETSAVEFLLLLDSIRERRNLLREQTSHLSRMLSDYRDEVAKLAEEPDHE
jgi:hypothetical protein